MLEEAELLGIDIKRESICRVNQDQYEVLATGLEPQTSNSLPIYSEPRHRTLKGLVPYNFLGDH